MSDNKQTNRLTGGQIDTSRSLKFSFDGKTMRVIPVIRLPLRCWPTMSG